jgi:hypothetical protein
MERQKVSTNKSSDGAPVTQEKKSFREGWPAWMKQMPRLGAFPPPNQDFELIPKEKLEELLADADPEAAKRLREDVAHLDGELLRMFRDRDHEAKVQQNRYRQYQIAYMLLAALATLFGSLIALSINVNAALVAFLSFAETVVALVTTYLATISGREPPLPLWMMNRRRAEHLRREYFRYLANLAPYGEIDGYERQVLLSRRAADINRGFFPDQQMSDEGGAA